MASLLQKFRCNLFPQELLTQFLRKTLPKETADRIEDLLGKIGVVGDAAIISVLAERLVDAIHTASLPETINTNLVDYLKRKHPEVYMTEMTKERQKRPVREVAEFLLRQVMARFLFSSPFCFFRCIFDNCFCLLFTTARWSGRKNGRGRT